MFYQPCAQADICKQKSNPVSPHTAPTHLPFAVISAMLLSRAKDRLNTLLVEPLAMNASPFRLFAREPSSRKCCKRQTKYEKQISGE